MDQQTRAALIARYRAGYQEVADALAGATEAELDHTADGWSARQIAHHLADSEMTSAIRLRRLIAEESPNVGSYDEEAFAKVLFYDRPIAASLAAFRAARETTADILDRLSDEQWTRAGSHPEHPTYGVEMWLEIYAAHGHDHAAQIRRAIGR